LSGLYSDGRANIDVFLKGHSGGPLRVKRSNRCTDLVKIALTIGLTVQPTVIEDLARGGKQIFRGKGLLGRPLYVIPRSNIGTRDVRLNVAIPPDVQKAYSNGIKTLLSIPRQLDENGIEVARILALSPEALDSWHRFAQWIEVRQGEGKEFERIQDWTGKLPGHALRIAALCHLAERLVSSKFTSSPLSPLSPSSLEGDSISKATMEAVLDLCEKLIVHAQAAFDLLESEESISDAKYAFKWLLTNREKDDRGAFFIRQNALHSCSRFKKSKLERVTRALEMLRERNIVSAQFKLPTRKPTLIFYVNPSVCEGGT
jgi:putative DNA primase/helicase